MCRSVTEGFVSLFVLGRLSNVVVWSLAHSAPCLSSLIHSQIAEISFTSMSFDKREDSSSVRAANDKKDNARNATMEGMVPTSFSSTPFSKKMRRSSDTPETFVSHEGEVSWSFVVLKAKTITWKLPRLQTHGLETFPSRLGIPHCRRPRQWQNGRIQSQGIRRQ